MIHSVPTYSREERRAAPSRPAVPSGLSPDEGSPGDCLRLEKGRALATGAACKAGAPYSAREGRQWRDERRAAPSRPAVPSGDGAPYSAREGHQ